MEKSELERQLSLMLAEDAVVDSDSGEFVRVVNTDSNVAARFGMHELFDDRDEADVVWRPSP